ncbi:sperm flagellar protein 1-like [Anopheles maculipalpis]|uniref:sperm flagellar protein 1-like n=1 Tax=Anopheles maculipalpis TaxID=1496333 RepID=UPI0021594C89|nr:sperm flagellar protein 1-like [Anopheles maculipalpis]
MPPRKKSIELSTQELIEVYKWVKKFNLSKEIKNINRDLSDGVLVAEILKHLYPKLVELHNYTRCNAIRNKLDNWQTLNRKVFRRLNIYLDDEMMGELAGGNNGMLEVLLYEVMARYSLENNPRHHSDEPGVMCDE